MPTTAGSQHLLFKATVLALCVTTIVHLFVFPLYSGGVERLPARTFSDFEQSLCTNNIRKGGRRWRPLIRCPQFGIVTASQGGRLGNQMWQYASVWAFGRRTGLEPYVPRCIRLKLEQVFERLSVPSLEEIGHCPIELGSFVRSLDAWNFTTQSIVLPRFHMQPDMVLTWVQDIVQEFGIRKPLLEKSQQVLRLAAKSSPNSNRTFVGVHVRRTDYILYLTRKYNAKPAERSFYEAAMRIFERKHQNVIFVMVSDAPKWCWERFGRKRNVYVTGRQQKNSPALDLAILASCNHTIIDYGTFGEWGAILAGGETVYYNLSQHSTAKVGDLLTNWYTI